MSNRSLAELKDEIECDDSPTEEALIALARISFQLLLREGAGNYDPAA